MSEPVKAADVINAILAGLALRDTQDVNTMHPNTLQEIIADLACGDHCGCKDEPKLSLVKEPLA